MAAKAIKLNVYSWEGKDRRGASVKGENRSGNIALVKADLRRQGITPIKVRKKGQGLFARSGPRKKPVITKDIAVFSRQLATMVTAGIPLVQALDIVGRGAENPSMQDLIMAIKNDVEGGSSLADSLEKHPKHFDRLFCNLVRAGEHAGVLDTLLHKIAEYKEKTESIKAKVKKALTYPISVVAIAIIVSAILLIYVVPQFESLFADFGADLPAFTRMVINLSEVVQAWWHAAIAILVVSVFILIRIHKQSRAFQEAIDRFVLHIPVVGDILNKSAIARFSRTLSTMFAAGVPLVEALESVAGATGNVVYSNAVLRVRDDVATGQQLQQSMQQCDLFPSMVLQMVAVGEESGALDNMLGKVAEFYEEEVDNAIDSLSSLIEPMIMAVLGVLVGGLVIAMYLPIFKLGAVV